MSSNNRNLSTHYKHKHIGIKRQYYVFKDENVLLQFLIREQFITGLQRVNSMWFHRKLENRPVMNYACKFRIVNGCKSQIIIKKKSQYFLVFFFGQHNHALTFKHNYENVKIKKFHYHVFHSTCRFSRLLSQSDAKMVDVYVKEFLTNNLTESHSCPIFVYKPQFRDLALGIPNEAIDRMQELFIIGLQTKNGLQFLSNSQVVAYAIDCSGESNIYNFPLVTIRALTFHNEGIVVAYFIVSETNETILTYLFEYIKPHIPTESTILTNYDPEFNTIVRNVFEAKDCLFCLFDVLHRIWQELQTLKNVMNITRMFTNIAQIIPSRSEYFSKNWLLFLTTWGQKYPGFVDKMLDMQATFSDDWNQSNRAFIDGNKYALRTINLLRARFCKKPVKRISDLLMILLSCDRSYFNGMRNALSAIANENHERGMKIETENVRRLNYRVYEVKEPPFTCRVYRIRNSCEYLGQCKEKCSMGTCVRLCCHLYVCSCDDNSAFCRHVHKVHSMVVNKRKSGNLFQ